MAEANYHDVAEQHKRYAKRLKLEPDLVESYSVIDPDDEGVAVCQDYIRGILIKLITGMHIENRMPPDAARVKAEEEARKIDIFISAKEEPNAALLPSREPPAVFVTRGLFEMVENEDQLAAVLAHEMTHHKVFDKVGAHRVGKEEEVMSDLNAAKMLHYAGYRSDAVLKVAEHFYEREQKDKKELDEALEKAAQEEKAAAIAYGKARGPQKDEAMERYDKASSKRKELTLKQKGYDVKKYFRVLTDEHPSWENRLTRLRQLNAGMRREYCAIDDPEAGKSHETVALEESILETLKTLKPYPTVIDSLLEKAGYADKTPEAKIAFWADLIESITETKLGRVQLSNIAHQLLELDFDPDAPAQDAAFDRLVDSVLFGNHRELRYNRQESIHLDQRINNEYPMMYDALWYSYTHMQLTKQSAEEEGKGNNITNPDNIAYFADPGHYYIGNPRKLYLAQDRFYHAADAETASREAKKIKELIAPYILPKEERDWSHRTPLISFYLGSRQGRRDPKWLEFAFDEHTDAEKGTLPPVAWDKHIKWAKDDADIAEALHMTGVSSDPRLEEIIGEQNEDSLVLIGPNGKNDGDIYPYRYKSDAWIRGQLYPYKEKEKPKQVSYEQQEEAAYQAQVKALEKVDWKELETDFWKFIDKHKAALTPALLDYNEFKTSHRTPFIDGFLDHVKSGVESGTIDVCDLRYFFALPLNKDRGYGYGYGEHEKDKETMPDRVSLLCKPHPKRVHLHDILLEQAKAMHVNEWVARKMPGSHPYVQFVMNSPLEWFDTEARLGVCHMAAVYDNKTYDETWRAFDNSLRKAKEAGKKFNESPPPVQKHLVIKPTALLGIPENPSVETALNAFEGMLHGYFGHHVIEINKGPVQEEYFLSVLLSAQKALEINQETLSVETLVRLGNLRAMAAYQLRFGDDLTERFTELLVQEAQKTAKSLEPSTIPFNQLVEQYRSLDSNFTVEHVSWGGINKLSVFDVCPDLRAVYEAKINDAFDGEQKAKVKRKSAERLLKQERYIEYKPQGKEVRTPWYSELAYSGKISSPSLRSKIVKEYVNAVSEELGQDDQTPEYQSRIEALTRRILKQVPDASALSILTQLGDAIEAQHDVAYYLRDQIKQRGLEKILADPWKAVLGEAGAEAVKGSDGFRMSMLEFLLEPVSNKSLDTFVDRLGKHKDQSTLLRTFGEEAHLRDRQSDFLKAKLADVHRDYWSLPLVVRAAALQDVLFPTGYGHEQLFELNKDLMYHLVLPVDHKPTGELAELLKTADIDPKQESKKQYDRYKVPYRWRLPRPQAITYPAVKAGVLVKGKTLDGIESVQDVQASAVATVYNAIGHSRFTQLLHMADYRTNQTARVFVDAYMNGLEDVADQQLVMCAMVAAQAPGEKKLGLGESVQQVLEAGRAAGWKLAQAIHSHPDTPDDIRDQMGKSKSDAAPPFRWQAFEWLERERLIGDHEVRQEGLLPIKRVGKRLGAGSYGVTFKLERGDETHTEESAITLLRDHVAAQAQTEFKNMRRAVDELVTKRPDFTSVRDMVHQAHESSSTETHMETAARQIDKAGELYDPLTVTVDGETFTFHVARLKSWGAGYKEAEIIPGEHFNDLVKDASVSPERKERLAVAQQTAEWVMLCRAGPFDEDRHGAQQRIKDNQIGIFDLGGLSLDSMSGHQKQLFGQLLGEVFKDRISAQARQRVGLGGKNGANKTVKAFVDACKKLSGNDDDRRFLARLTRTMLAQQDFARFVPPERTIEIFAAMGQNGFLDPAIEEGMKRRLGTANKTILERQLAKITPHIEISGDHLKLEPMGKQHAAARG